MSRLRNAAAKWKKSYNFLYTENFKDYMQEAGFFSSPVK